MCPIINGRLKGLSPTEKKPPKKRDVIAAKALIEPSFCCFVDLCFIHDGISKNNSVLKGPTHPY